MTPDECKCKLEELKCEMEKGGHQAGPLLTIVTTLIAQLAANPQAVIAFVQKLIAIFNPPKE